MPGFESGSWFSGCKAGIGTWRWTAIKFDLLALAADWPQYRGPNRDGSSKETGLLQEWPKDGPKLLWTYADAGVGYAGPAALVSPAAIGEGVTVVRGFADAVILGGGDATAIVGNDQTYLQRPCVRWRTIQLDTHSVGIVEFDAPQEKRDTLVANGRAAVEAFLATWDWERFKRECP